MFELEIKLNQFMLGYGDRLLADITDSEFRMPTSDGGHSPQWIVGHLLMAADYAALMVGLRPHVSKAVRQPFLPGQPEVIQQGEEFSKDALCDLLRPTYERLYEPTQSAGLDVIS